MSSYNNIEKIKYTKNQQDVVALKEYIIFDDEMKKDKHIVFKFINNLNQNLYEIKFEVCQYDENENLIGKSTLLYDNFTAESYETFVPNAKMKVLYPCKSVSVKLLFARFTRVTWENDQFKDIPYSFEECKSQNGKVTSTVKSKKEVKEEKYEVGKISKEEKSRRKRAYVYQDIKKAHKAGFPKFFHVFFSVVTGLALVGTTIVFNRQSDVFTIGDYDVREVGVGQYSIVKYDGFDKEVIIPTEINGNRVVKIEEGAFKFSGIKSVIIEHEVELRAKAFQHCNNLEVVSSQQNLSIPYLAFFKCQNIKNINIPNSNIQQASFFGSKNIEQLTFNYCSTDKLSEAFINEGSGKVKIDTLYTNMTHINGHFFDDCIIDRATFSNDNVLYEYGALSSINQSGVIAIEGLEIEDGRVVAVDYESGNITISPAVIEFDLNKFDRLNEIHSLKVDNYNIRITNEFLRRFPNLITLEVTDVSCLDYDALNSTSISTLIAPLSETTLATYARNSYVNELVIKPGYTDYVYGYYFSNIPSLTSIRFETDVFGMDYNAFDGLYNLRRTDLVLNSDAPLIYQYSNLYNLEEVNIINNHNMNTIPVNAFEGMNMLRSATFGEGFVNCNGPIVSNSYSLESLKLPKSLSITNYPLVGEYNKNLRKVELTCSDIPEYFTYKDVNLSAEFTTELKLNGGIIPTDFFKSACEQITHLCIDADFCPNPIGLLSSCQNLVYLDLRVADLPITYISDLFAQDSNVKNNVLYMPYSLNTVSLSKLSIGDYFFTGCKYLTDVYLLNIGKVKKNIFENCISLRSVYLSDACRYTNGLLRNLNKIAGITICFQSESPRKRKANYLGNVDVDSILHWEG